jgi:serine/threonine-protein kinase
MAEYLGKYELLQVLGKGAMGTVYEGFDPVIARRLAIKTVRLPNADDVEAQEELARFKREAQAAGSLSHPNIVGVFDYGETAELAYIVMEFVDDTTLKQLLDKKERFKIGEIVRLMEGILNGLQFSHDRGVVHRDIKPANIMLTKAGEVKIADFGIARIESSSMTQVATMLGTPSYMSPEQFMGQTVDSRTDIYSAGVVLYQLLTGEKPFEGGLTAIMHKVLNSEPPPPSALSVTVPQTFDAVVKKAMAKRPGDRYESAKLFAQALQEAYIAKSSAELAHHVEEFAESEATLVLASSAAVAIAKPQPVAREAVPVTKKSPSLLLIGGAISVVILIAAAYFLFGRPHSPAPANVAASPPPPAMTQAQEDSTLSAILASLPCTLLTATNNAGHMALTGMAGAGAPQAALTAALASLPAAIVPVSSVQIIDGPYCDALNSIRPYHNFFPVPGMQLGLSLANGVTTLHNNDLITVKNAMPGFAGYLQTDYYSSDGTVFHLYPSATDPLKQQPANSIKVLGDPKNGGATWQVSTPYGPDMIISIATASPLFATSRQQDENATDYLPALQAALQNATSASENFAVAATQVVTEK